MKLTADNLIHHELIGLEAEVMESTNPSLAGIRGRVVDETKNLLVIEDKKVQKSHTTFAFTLPSHQRVKVDGRLLLSQPENRIQTRFKKKFRR